MDNTKNIKLEIFNGVKGIKQIEEQWTHLFEKLNQPVYTQSYIWHQAYIQHLTNSPENNYYFCIYKSDSLVAIFPLEYFSKRVYLFKLTVLGFSEHSHFGINSIIVDDNENPQELFVFLFNELKKQNTLKWSLIYFDRALKGSQVEKCTLEKDLCVSVAGNVCDVLLIQDYELTLKRLSRNFKGNLRKARKKLSNESRFLVNTVVKSDTINKQFDHFLNIEASGWKGSSGKGSAIKLDPDLHAFYEHVMKGFADNEQIEINTLVVNDVPVAAHFAIIMQDTVYLLKIGYDESYGYLSPGNMLLEYKLKDYAEKTDLKYLNLISDAYWHNSWEPEVITSRNIFNCRNQFIALYVKSVLSLRKNIKRIITTVKSYRRSKI